MTSRPLCYGFGSRGAYDESCNSYDRQQHQREARKQLTLGAALHTDPSPECERWRRAEQADNVGAEGAYLPVVAHETEVAVHGGVPVEHRRERHDRNKRSQADREQCVPLPAQYHEPQGPQADEDGEHHQGIPVGRTLKHPCRAVQREPPPAPRLAGRRAGRAAPAAPRRWRASECAGAARLDTARTRTRAPR